MKDLPAIHGIFLNTITDIRELVQKQSHATNLVLPLPPVAYTVVAAPSMVEVLAESM